MSRAASVEPSASLLPTPSGYIQQATLPLTSLVFLLPLVIIYDAGTRYFTTAALHGGQQQIIAFSKMEEFFRLFGATGRHMPALAVIGMLLAWHVARKDSWKIELSTIVGMGVESTVLGLPLLLLAFLVNHYFPLIGLQGVSPRFALGGSPISDRLIMDVGAGVYEEFVFRLVLFTFASLWFEDILRLGGRLSCLLMVVMSGVLFSLYHYWSPTEHFSFRVFAFRALAGIYFGLIFLFRGIGITAGSHCAYDIIVTLC